MDCQVDEPGGWAGGVGGGGGGRGGGRGVCEFIEEEEAHLRAELLAQGTYNEATATVGERRCCRCRSPALCLLLGRDRLADLGGVACRGGQGPPPCRASIKACRFLGTSLVPAEAKGVVASRLQNVVITLDKVKMVLRAPGQVRGHTAGECSGMHRLARLCALARRALAMRSEALPVAAANQPLLLWGEGGGGGAVQAARVPGWQRWVMQAARAAAQTACLPAPPPPSCCNLGLLDSSLFPACPSLYPPQPQGPCLRLLTDAEAVDFLWEGEQALCCC